MSILVCPQQPPYQRGDLLKFITHAAAVRPHVPDCAWPHIVNVSNIAHAEYAGSERRTFEAHLASWNVQLLRHLLARRVMTESESVRIRDRLGRRYASKGGNYAVLKHTLDHALDDPTFRTLALQQHGMWLEFGVLTGLSINITSKFLDALVAPHRGGGEAAAAPTTPLPLPADALIHGFDTFTGLPEAWPNGKGGYYYKKGTFSWAARKKGPTPPVRKRVRLHTGLFNNTLPPFLASATARYTPTAGLLTSFRSPRPRPLAWANIDCDLYAGTRDALFALSSRVCHGTRLHFHELLKDRYWKARHLESGRAHAVAPSEEARALFEWLVAYPEVELELLDVISRANSDAAAFVVRKPPNSAAVACA